MRQPNISCCVGIALLVFGTSGASAMAVTGIEQATPATKSTPQRDTKPRTGFEDWWITMKIHSQFVPDDALEDSDIDVDTAARVVTLSGTVASEAGRARAVQLARATEGVKSVNDKLRVAPESDRTARDTADAAKAGGRRVTDGWIKSKVYAQFLTEDALQESDIDVDVKSGVVTLKGTVNTEAARTRAVAIAKATDGVKNVNDALKVVTR